MKRWLAGIGIGAMGAVCVAACGEPQGSGKAPSPGETAICDRGTHAQSAKLRGGGLEGYPFFYGKLNADGMLDARELSAGSLDSNGNPQMDPGQKVIVRDAAKDECFPYDRVSVPGAALYAYNVTIPGGGNLCCNEKALKVDPDDVSDCRAADSSERAFERLNEKAIAVRGYFDSKGRYKYSEEIVTLACITGVVAKCANWGYVPGATAKNGGTPLTPHFQACVQAARAEYKPGESFTCRDTPVDIFDSLTPPIQAPHEPADNKQLESMWDANGATCVEKTRFKCDSSTPATAGACKEKPGLITIRSGENKAPNGCPGVPNQDNSDPCDDKRMSLSSR